MTTDAESSSAPEAKLAPLGALGPLGRAPLSPAVEDYLKAIYALRSEGGADGVVNTQALADYLRVAPASASNMAKKLASMGLAHHTPYRGLELSETGEKMALEVVRHHRIIETFLAEVLGLSWDKVHDEAERWEHVLSEEVEQLMMDKLGHPTRDPHGAPIPSREGTLPRDEDAMCLCEAGAGENFTVTQVADEDGATLRHLESLGVRPGALLFIERNEKVEGVLHLRPETGEIRVLGHTPARGVLVQRAR